MAATTPGVVERKSLFVCAAEYQSTRIEPDPAVVAGMPSQDAARGGFTGIGGVGNRLQHGALPVGSGAGGHVVRGADPDRHQSGE